MVTIDQMNAARGVLQWSYEKLAAETGLSRATLINIASGKEAGRPRTLEKIRQAFERCGVELLEGGARLVRRRIEIIEGADCYLKLLDKAALELMNTEDKTLLIMFSSDAVSPPDVNERYRFMRANGIEMRQLVRDGDTYLLGPLAEYRTIPESHFVNIVTLVYAGYVAQVDGTETSITVYRDAKLAQRERGIFEYLWNLGKQPDFSVAEERF